MAVYYATEPLFAVTQMARHRMYRQGKIGSHLEADDGLLRGQTFFFVILVVLELFCATNCMQSYVTFAVANKGSSFMWAIFMAPLGAIAAIKIYNLRCYYGSARKLRRISRGESMDENDPASIAPEYYERLLERSSF